MSLSPMIQRLNNTYGRLLFYHNIDYWNPWLSDCILIKPVNEERSERSCCYQSIEQIHVIYWIIWVYLVLWLSNTFLPVIDLFFMKEISDTSIVRMSKKFTVLSRVLTVSGHRTIGIHSKLPLLHHVLSPLVLIIGIRWMMDIIPMQLTVKDTSIICNERWEQGCTTHGINVVDSITEQYRKAP